MEVERRCLAILDHDPFVPYAGPVVEYLVTLDEQRAVLQRLRRRRLKHSRHPLLGNDIDQENSTRLQVRERVVKDVQIMVSIVEISEGGVHADDHVEGGRSDELPHVLLNPLDLHSSLLGPSPRFLQEESGPIDPCHDEPFGGQGMANLPGPQQRSSIFFPCGFASRTSLSAWRVASENRRSENMNGLSAIQNASSSNHSLFLRTFMCLTPSYKYSLTPSSEHMESIGS